MQVSGISVYNYPHANQRQQVGFGSAAFRIIPAKELLDLASKVGIIIREADGAGVVKSKNQIMHELQQILVNPKPLQSPLGVMQRHSQGEQQFRILLQEQIVNSAAELGVNTRGKSTIVVAGEVVDAERLLKQARDNSYSPRSQTFDDLKIEMAQKFGKTTQAPSPRPATANPQGNGHARSTLGAVPVAQKAISMRELLKRGPNSKYEAVAVINYFGETITMNSSREEILKATSRLMRKFHPERQGGNEANMKLVTAAKSLLVQSSTGNVK